MAEIILYPSVVLNNVRFRKHRQHLGCSVDHSLG